MDNKDCKNCDGCADKFKCSKKQKDKSKKKKEDDKTNENNMDDLYVQYPSDPFRLNIAEY